MFPFKKVCIWLLVMCPLQPQENAVVGKNGCQGERTKARLGGRDTRVEPIREVGDRGMGVEWDGVGLGLREGGQKPINS